MLRYSNNLVQIRNLLTIVNEIELVYYSNLQVHYLQLFHLRKRGYLTDSE